jgi:hypothetical protein
MKRMYLITTIIVLLLIAILAMQVYMMMEWRRPIMRPAPKAPTRMAPELPGAWYEKFKDTQGFDSEQVFYFVV